MSQTSVGSESANDDNENHPRDSLHSKTLGAEAGGPESAIAAAENAGLRFAPRDNAPGDPAGGALPADPGAAPAGDVLQSLPVRGVPVDPGAYPDGPNVEASPWELDAARGELKPDNLAPQASPIPDDKARQ